MADQSSGSREHWSGILGFILAAVGSAVGLGNIWRFPFITGRYGGGAFVLVYLMSVVVIGLPLLVGEMKIGRRSQRGPVGAFAALGRDAFGGKAWKIFGFLAIATGFVLLSYYSVVGGWTFGYSIKALYGQLIAGSPKEAGAFFGTFIGDEVQVTMAHALFMIAVIGIVYSGISDGIERATRILMPIFGVLLLGLFAYSMTTEGVARAFSFMFEPRWDQLGVEAILAAVGQACFTLSIGMGAIIVYGSYLNEDDPIYSSSLTVAVANTSVSLIAALVIFSTIFATVDIPSGDLPEKYQGAGLAFQIMPKLFAQMPGGSVLAAAFFLLLAFAAISSAISLLEVVVSYFIEEFDVARDRAAVWCGIAILFMGIPSALGFNLWSHVTLEIGSGEKNILSILDHVVVSYALPLGVLGVAGYAGWAVDPDEWADEIETDPWADYLFDGWLWLVRIVSPAAVVIILLSNMGLFG